MGVSRLGGAHVGGNTVRECVCVGDRSISNQLRMDGVQEGLIMVL